MSKILLILLIVAAGFGLQRGILRIDWSVLARDAGLPFTVAPQPSSGKNCPER